LRLAVLTPPLLTAAHPIREYGSRSYASKWWMIRSAKAALETPDFSP
jgi:hypothetical protein